jgi:hypothetical protein
MTCRICGATISEGYAPRHAHVCIVCRLKLEKFLEDDNGRKGRMSVADKARRLIQENAT